MAGKDKRVRTIDAEKGVVGGGQVVTAAPPSVGPAVPTLPPPTGLQVDSNTLMLSAQVPMALVNISWRPPLAQEQRQYEIQIALDGGFTTGVTTLRAGQASAALELITDSDGILYYIRVRAISGPVVSAWSSAVSVTTASDTTAPGVPTGLAATFNAAGDLEITWTNPSGTSFRDVEVSIYADSGFSTLLFRTYSATQRIVWTASQNRQAGSGTPDPAVFVRMASRSWAGVLSSTVVPSTQPVKAVPANVSGLTQSWSGDAGLAGPDLTIAWSAASGATYYRLTLDGVARDVYSTRYVLTLDQNRAEHSGTPDPAISISIVGVDGLDQVSATPTTTTATNAAPAAPSSVTLVAFFTTLSISVGSVLPADGLIYRFRLIQTSPGASDITWDSLSQLQTRAISASATYQVGVRAVDVFGQLSSETLSSTTVADGLTLADLRSGARYSDSQSTAATALKAALADGILSGGTGTNSPTFVAATGLAVANGATSVAQTPPVGVAIGDLMVAHVVARGDGQTIATPDGWTLIASTLTTNTTPSPDVIHAAFWRIARSNETTPYTFSVGSSNTVGVVIAVYRGVSGSAPINASGSTTTASSTTITAPTITTSVTNTLLLFLAAAGVAQTSTPNGSLVERYDASGGTNVVMTYGASEALAASGATGTRTATTTAAAATIGTLIALAPTTTTAISYASNAGWARWVRYERDVIDRYEVVTLSMAPASGTTTWYVRTSTDGTTWTYFSGPVVSSRILTQVASEAAAQSAAISAATLGNSSASRVELPVITEARYVEVWLRNTAAATLVSEYYPRRIVQSDDIEAESLRALLIAAGSITADRLSVSQLSAIAADLGTITAGTVTGATIQTATSGARVELTSANGLRSFDSGGTVQAQIRTSDGAIVAGGGNVLVNANGISVITNNTWALANSYRILDASGNNSYGGVGGIRLVPNSAGITLRVDSSLSGLDNSYAYLEAICSSGDTARATVRANITGGGESGELYIETTASASLAYADVDVMRLRGDMAIQSGGAAPAATLDVYRGTLSSGTAVFRGTTYNSHFNFSTNEDTYIRAGKVSSTVYVNDSHNGPVSIAAGGGIVTIGAGGGATTINSGGGAVTIASGGGDVTISNSTSSQIGIGTSPISNHKVTINGDTATGSNYALVVRNSSSTNLFYAENNGGLWANVAWTISDEREKHNIRDFDERDLTGLLQLRIRRYARTISGDDETGLIAQELAQVYPALVREGLDGVLGYRQGDLVTMLLAGYQQLSRRIAALERRG